ncbi:MAG: T9SS type A sorting domain-containing protein, partial [Bacteroidales bacterium]|nr:T9SS type A sorting domain-containing protein [Bacteroidales bacterium]
EQDIYAAIFDLNGRMLQAYQLNNKKSSIDVQNLQSGIYILKVSTGNESQVLKIRKD